MRIRSLRLQLLAWLVLPLAGVVAVNVWTSYGTAVSTADLVTHRMLTASARAIAEPSRADRGVIEAIVPPVALEMFATGHQDRVYYRVETATGRLLTGYPDLPLPPRVPSDFEPLFYDGAYRGQPLDLVMMLHPLVGAGAEGPIRVMVGVTRAGHGAMVRQLWIGGFGQQVLLLVAAAILALIGLDRGLTPLLRLRDAVQRRSQEDLAPFSAEDVQTELRPLVGALNQYMDRVQKQMAAQRRFVANAAHQLRTPLALLSTQASYALREKDPDERTLALKALQASARQLARLAAQLLTLARAEPGSRRPRSESIDLAAAARLVTAEFAEGALARGIDIGVEAEGEVRVTGDGTMLREMIVNLVDNATRYAGDGGIVTVSVARERDEAVLRVADSGPGIPPAERERVFERFYRVLGTTAEGSGLGLAIVKEVADAAAGSVALRDAEGGGLVVEVRLPLAQENAAAA
ncbi:sensor histidine kinase N-terminal domain-containing protein [Xanthobacter sp. VNH20]|uniref:sensor histidine kinase n=1 Tax=Xanthobacter sp. VNH20 TaxID=3156616 RepID=UPI0032B3DD2E